MIISLKQRKIKFKPTKTLNQNTDNKRMIVCYKFGIVSYLSAHLFQDLSAHECDTQCSIVYYLLTESEVITVKSRTEALMY